MSLSPSALAIADALVERIRELAPLRSALVAAATAVRACHRADGKVLCCGNGGSAADAEHIVGELMKGFLLDRRLPEADVARLRQAGVGELELVAGRLQRGVPAFSLNAHAALTSAIANDLDPSLVFAQQVYACGRAGDVLIGLSTSGEARNVVRAAEVARALGLATIAFTGARPCALDRCAITLKAPATETWRVQEYHLPLYHALCAMVEQEAFGN
jgi:D-sedoheptulose 7-phosphate isomerase